MTLRDLEAELAASGFVHVRNRSSHRIYRSECGKFVVVAMENGRPFFDRWHVREIRKQLARNA
jgi:predicted RNA binding protein YcfA (HicA-like mRNA interferase family)